MPQHPATPGGRERRDALYTVVAILIADLWAGLAWLISSPRRTMTIFFGPARSTFDFLPFDPQRAWGGVLAVLALVGLIAYFCDKDEIVRGAFIALAAYFAFWFFLDIASATQPLSSLTSPAFRMIVIVGHIRQAVAPIKISIAFRHRRRRR